MPEIIIPPEIVPGFKSIIKLSKKSVQQIVDYLIEAKVSSNPNDFLRELDNFIKSNLQIDNSKGIVETIASFIELIKEDSYEKVSENLANSFKELHAPNISEKDFTSLRNNLEQIIKATSNLELSLKAYSLLGSENKNIYQRSKVVSDIRLIFNKEFDKKNRKAVLVHNLHITYKSNSKNKNFFVALDLEDLKSIQLQIERAIKKDTIIKNEYKDFEII
jgi:hypothetical protein